MLLCYMLHARSAPRLAALARVINLNTTSYTVVLHTHKQVVVGEKMAE